MRLIAKERKDNIERLNRLCETLWDKAEAGDMTAAKIVLGYLQPMPQYQHEPAFVSHEPIKLIDFAPVTIPEPSDN